MNNLLQPLPVDQLDQSYSYIVLIELAFGKQKAVDTYNKFRMGSTTQVSNQGKPVTQAVMSQRFKDDIEVKLTLLLNWVHQISKGSYILNQQQFLAVFEPVGILVTAQDRELLNQTFQMLKQQQTQTINFNTFVTHFAISDVTAGVIAGLQKVISEQNIRVSDEDTGSTLFTKDMVSLEDFNKFLETQKIEIPGFTPRQINDAFAQMSERKGAIDKNRLIRILKNEREFVRVNAQQAQPFIVSEFINHIVNNKVNLFNFITAKSQSLIIAHFNELIKKIKYVPSNPKDLPQLIKHFADQEPSSNAEPRSVSIPKILAEIRKKDPQYALETTIINQAANTLGVKLPNAPQQLQAPPKLTPQQVTQSQLSSFTQRVKDILLKINDQLKRSGLSNSQLFSKIDVNSTSTIVKQEFIQFFQKDLIVKGLTLDEIHLAFDSLDMNKDGVLSINEFCLLLEGVQHNFDQKLRQFDPELEKTLKDEINMLFDFFDTNKDNVITQQELESALKSQNPNVTLNETLTIMKLADRDMNKQIDRKEFTEIMLPQLKAEVINKDQNLDDLRRLFKEFDLDQSNYLSKVEFREALVRLGVILSDVQVDDLLKEIDLDQNNVIDIDEFIAFLAIADQVRFSNPANKAILIKIKHAKKLQPIDFYNSFKNLPQSFQTSILTEPMEKSYLHTPSHGLYPQFDGKTMNYRELQKLEEFTKVPAKKFIEMFHPQMGSEITIEEATGVPLPKKEDFDWGKIINREVRVVLVDAKNQDLLSNVFVSQAAWKQDAPSKWTFNASEIQASGRQFVVRSDSLNTEPSREVHLVFELILFTKLSDGVQTQQVCCSWASIPLNQLDKQAKIKISLKGGRVLQEIKIAQDQIHQEKKGFEFLKKLTASSDEPLLTISIKPFIKLTEQQQLHLSMLPNNVLVNRKLLSFAAIFRLLAFRRLTKSQQQMLAPAGNFAIAQFRKIFDNPDVNLLLADCWENYESTAPKGQFTVDEYLAALEEFLVKTYAIIYCEGFHFDHVYPTRGANSVDSELFIHRETMIKQQLAPQKYKKMMMKTAVAATGVNKENNKNANNEPVFEDYKPFNIAEMEIPIVGVVNSIEAKQDELTKMYQQMGLLLV